MKLDPKGELLISIRKQNQGLKQKAQFTALGEPLLLMKHSLSELLICF